MSSSMAAVGLAPDLGLPQFVDEVANCFAKLSACDRASIQKKSDSKLPLSDFDMVLIQCLRTDPKLRAVLTPKSANPDCMRSSLPNGMPTKLRETHGRKTSRNEACCYMPQSHGTLAHHLAWGAARTTSSTIVMWACNTPKKAQKDSNTGTGLHTCCMQTSSPALRRPIARLPGMQECQKRPNIIRRDSLTFCGPHVSFTGDEYAELEQDADIADGGRMPGTYESERGSHALNYDGNFPSDYRNPSSEGYRSPVPPAEEIGTESETLANFERLRNWIDNPEDFGSGDADEGAGGFNGHFSMSSTPRPRSDGARGAIGGGGEGETSTGLDGSGQRERRSPVRSGRSDFHRAQRTTQEEMPRRVEAMPLVGRPLEHFRLLRLLRYSNARRHIHTH